MKTNPDANAGSSDGVGSVGSERQGLWAYYYVIPDALEELSSWLTS